MLKDGKLNFYWTTTTNNMQAGPNINEERYPGLPQPGELHRRLRRLPDGDGAGRRPDPAGGDVDGEGRRLRQRRAAHAVLAPAGEGAGRGEERPVAVHRVLQALQDRRGVAEAEMLDKNPQYKGKTLYEVLYANGQVEQVPEARRPTPTQGPATGNDESRLSASTCRRACSRNTASLRRGHGHDLGEFDTYHKVRGLRWPVVDGKETLWRYREGYDPYVKAGEGVKFYGKPDGKAAIFALPYAAGGRNAGRRSTTCGCAPAACWSTGIPAR
jgi:nitrate reductase NapA